MPSSLAILRFLGFLWFLGFSGFPGQTAQTPATGIGGVVTAASKPLAGVSVQAVRAGSTVAAATATTGADGRYQLAPIAQGVYRVEYSLAGFDPQTRTGVVVFDKTIVELNVALARLGTAGAGTLSARPGEVIVRLETTLGYIFIAVDTTHAPVTAANFLKYVDGGFYDGGRFHRATRPNRPMMEIIQGGINPDRRSGAFPAIPLERTSVTGLKHVRGVVSMARGTADSATSDFFILLDDQPSLDFGGMRFDDGQGAAAFGRVLSGIEIVRRIQQQPVQGQNLTPPVPIVAAKRQ